MIYSKTNITFSQTNWITNKYKQNKSCKFSLIELQYLKISIKFLLKYSFFEITSQICMIK